jgi:hypothetical protein
VANGIVTAMAAWLIAGSVVTALLPHRLVTLLFVLVFGAFSLAEVPMMVFSMRRLVVERKGNLGFVLGLNTLFVFFAAVYGAPVLFLTGHLGWGLALCGLGLVRLVASQLFVKDT